MNPSPKHQCLTDLRERILTTDIAPGSDLDETELSTSYGISRTPLREVLQRLAGDGYVTLLANRGAKVASMDLSVMRTFFQTAPLIYSSIARLAAEHRTTAQLEDLKAVQSAFAKAVSAADAQGMALNNHRFHNIIGDMAANDYLMASLKRLLIDHTRLGQMFYRPASPAEAVAVKQASQQHDAMIAAIEAQESAVVVDLTLQHWDLSRDRMERFVRPDPLPLDVVDFMEKKNAV
ncbi:MAG: GntR family transcriptional regulator [Pseudomonadota bacterium]